MVSAGGSSKILRWRYDGIRHGNGPHRVSIQALKWLNRYNQDWDTGAVAGFVAQVASLPGRASVHRPIYPITQGCCSNLVGIDLESGLHAGWGSWYDYLEF